MNAILRFLTRRPDPVLLGRDAVLPDLWYCVDCGLPTRLDRHAHCSMCAGDRVVASHTPQAFFDERMD